MKILSWNILADEFIKKRYYPMIPPELLLNRKQRQTQIITTLTAMDMDVLLLQEVMLSEYKVLLHTFQLTHHIVRGKNIKWQNKQGASGNVILLRKTLFQLPTSLPIISLTFGLGLHCLYKKQPFVIFNIHLDDLSVDLRHKQFAELLLHNNQNAPVIIGGDFNEHYNVKKPSMLYMAIKAGGLKILNQAPSYYIERKMCIDNILIKGVDLKHHLAHIMNPLQGDPVKQFQTYGSDHLPVVVN
jgi:endonuclease/exonuclease/phosphatase family metal-dependent hydrolase